MANLTENTQYDKQETQSSPVDYSKIKKESSSSTTPDVLKNYKSTIQAALATKPSVPSSDTKPSFHSMYYKPASAYETGAPVGLPLQKQEEGAQYQTLPKSYSQFAPVDEKGNWVKPSDQARLRNWPSHMGGGQYISDPTQPGKMVKSVSTIMNPRINPGAKRKILGGLSPNLYQVDHIIPLWAGGADTLENLEVLDVIAHEEKTVIQSVALTLLANKKINLNEARRIAFTWKDKDSEGLPSPGELERTGGFVPLKVAQEYKKKWKEDIKDEGKWQSHFAEAWGESANEIGNDYPILAEFSKGVTGGVSFGIVPGMEKSDDSGIIGGISHTVGSIIGFGVGLTGVGWGAKGLWGGAAKGIGWGARGMKSLKGVKGFKTAQKGIETAKKVKNLKELNSVKQATAIVNKVAKSKFGYDVGNVGKRTRLGQGDRMSHIIRQAGLFSTYNALGVLGKDLTKQEEADFGDYAAGFLSGGATGVAFGVIPTSLKGIGFIGSGFTMLSMMQGSDFEDALMDGALMAGMHGLGNKKLQKWKLLQSKKIWDISSRMGFKNMENEHGYRELTKASYAAYGENGNLLKRFKTGEIVPDMFERGPKFKKNLEKLRVQYHNQHPNDPRTSVPVTDKTSAKQDIDLMDILARKEISNRYIESVAKGEDISPDLFHKELIRMAIAKNHLLNQSLPPGTIRNQKRLEDTQDLRDRAPQLTEQPKTWYEKVFSGEALQEKRNFQAEQQHITKMGGGLQPQIKSKHLRFILDSPKELENFSFSNKKFPNKEGIKFQVVGNVPLTRAEVDFYLEKNIGQLDILFKKNKGNPIKIAFVKDENASKVLKILQNEQIRDGIEPNVGNPNHALRAFYKNEKGKWDPLGNAPREISYNGKGEFSLNALPNTIKARFEKILRSSTDTKDLKRRFKESRNKVTLDEDTARILFENKKTYSGEEIYEKVKPFLGSKDLVETYDSTLNNSAIATEMDRLGIKVVSADLHKTYTETVSGHPRVVVKFTDQSWLEGMARSKGDSTLGASAPIEKAIKETMKRQTGKKVSQSLKEGRKGLKKADKSVPIVTEKTEVLPITIKGKIDLSKNPLKREPSQILSPDGKTYQPNPNFGKEKVIKETPPKTVTMEGKTYPVAPVSASQKAVGAISTAKRRNVPSQPKKTLKTTEKPYFKTSIESSSPKKATLTDNLFSEIKERVNAVKADKSSITKHESSLKDEVSSFKGGKKPGDMSLADYQKAVNEAKSRGNAYVQDFIDSQYKNTEVFGTTGIYKRAPQKDNTNVLLKRYNELKAKQEGYVLDDKISYIKPSELTEMKALKTKINKHVELAQKIVELKKRPKPLTKREETEIRNFSKQRFELTQDYLKGKDTSLVLANKFGLELQPPNEAGISFLKLDKKTSQPTFSKEFKSTHNTTKTPIEYWGSFLSDEMKVYKNNLSRNITEWGESIKKMKKAESPYAKGFAEAMDVAMTKKFGKNWKTSWKANTLLKNAEKNWANATNEQGYSISQTYRRIAAITTGKNQAQINKNIAKVDLKTKKISEEAKTARENRQAVKQVDENFHEGVDRLKAKDDYQSINVANDLTPFTEMTTGLLNTEARNNLIGQYNSLRKEIAMRPTHIKPDQKIVKETKLLFDQIKALSIHIPEEAKKWKFGHNIELKNKGEPTHEQGMDDALRVFANILKQGKSSPGYVDFEEVKQGIRNWQGLKKNLPKK